MISGDLTSDGGGVGDNLGGLLPAARRWQRASLLDALLGLLVLGSVRSCGGERLGDQVQRLRVRQHGASEATRQSEAVGVRPRRPSEAAGRLGRRASAAGRRPWNGAASWRPVLSSEGRAQRGQGVMRGGTFGRGA